MGDAPQKPTPEQIAEAIAENRRLLGEDEDNPFSTSGQFGDEPSLIEQTAKEYRETVKWPEPPAWGPKRKGNGRYSEDYIPIDEFVGPARVDFASSLHVPIPPRVWLDRHRLLRKNTAFQLNGDGGIGKTEITLQMMIGMCATGTMFNLPVDRGPCLFVSFEEPENEVRWRIDHLAHAFNIPSANVRNLEILDLTGERDPWMFKERSEKGYKELIPTDRWTWLQKEFEQKWAFIAMDNKTRFFAANQNDAVLSTSYAHHIELACRDHNTTIMPLAHVSLSQLQTGRGDLGSVAAGNAFRSRLLFGHPKADRDADEPDEGERKLTVMKTNAGSTGVSLPFQWHKGLEFFDCTYVPPKIDETIGRYDKAKRVTMILMRLHAKEYLPLSNNPRSPYYAPNLFVARDERENVSFKEFKVAIQNLLHEGMLKIAVTGPKSKEVAHLEIA